MESKTRPSTLRYMRFFRASVLFICTALFSWLLLGIYRSFIIDPQTTLQGLSASIPSGIAASYHDLVFVVFLTAAALVLLFLAMGSRSGTVVVVFIFYLAILVLLGWGFANINLVKMLSEPFTFQWLVYGDFLQNADAKNAMRDAFNLRDFAASSLSIILVLVLGYAAARLCLRLGATGRTIFLGTLILCVAAALFGTGRYLQVAALPAAKIENPIVHFVESGLLNPTPVVFTMKVDANDPDVSSVGERPAETSNFKAQSPNPIKNVLVFMMESVPSRHIETFGGEYPVTPNIKRFSSDSMRFEKIYSHAPSTQYSIFSLFSSMYNDISYYGMTASHPNLPLSSISSTLSENGFRTAFFWSADSRFQRVDEFLLKRALDVVKDYRGQKCNVPTFRLSDEKWKNMDYNSDLCTAQSIIDWVNADSEDPFFAVMFTAMTHYPYLIDSPLFSAMPASSQDSAQVHYSDDEKFNAYLNALKIGDQALGQILDSLKQSGKLDSTLVVILGDHGEAFGEHGNYVHASALYEENVHIPLIMINKQLFHDDVVHSVGGIVDIAPTILDILGLPLPKSWQGHSLFSKQRPNRTFFFSPWSGYQFGYREDDRKVIFNASTGKIEEYDLEADPTEKVNLVKGDTRDHSQLLRPIAGWVQSQKRRVADMVADEQKNTARCRIASLEIDAAGTSFEGSPRLDVLVDGKPVGQADVLGTESTAITAESIVAELKAASAHTVSFRFNLSAVTNPQKIELRYANDLWAGQGKAGDRNLFVKNIKIDGRVMPKSKLHVDNKTVGFIDDSGTSMFNSGSLWVSGPFVEGCI
ncbi:sulfatase-like hydrolase/transferase [Mesorhizobium sp. M7A.F.Ca.US.010.02.1.1]|uniref:sulfatase-like hydrolase/transferase n=1 Tax=Mesorhizobium sp. M7A.F.Ca.US.010.02.1.1 TaxID=2496743 RepID=UPI0013E35103|nr:sulfatase-like hydrolase/transferase [Mesorhizobium sp. M7A.F.Ca.US.010.02.1.1]